VLRSRLLQPPSGYAGGGPEVAPKIKQIKKTGNFILPTFATNQTL
jgi:hypothetical protein